MIQDNSNKKKLIVITIIAFVFFILVILASIAIFSQLNKKTTNNTAANTSLIKSADIISAYSVPNTIAALSADLYRQGSSPSNTINYRLNSHRFNINTTTDKSLLFVKIDKSKTDNTKDIQTQSTAFMKQKGLNPDSVTTPKTDDTTYLTFSNDNTVCQLTDYQPPTDSIATQYHMVSCIEKSSIAQEYTQINKLLALRSADTTPKFTHAVRETVTEGNVSYSIIFLTLANGKHSLPLFATVDNKWEELGDLASGDPKYQNDRYTITPELRAKIDDPKYKGVIAKQIF